MRRIKYLSTYVGATWGPGFGLRLPERKGLCWPNGTLTKPGKSRFIKNLPTTKPLTCFLNSGGERPGVQTTAGNRKSEPKMVGDFVLPFPKAFRVLAMATGTGLPYDSFVRTLRGAEHLYGQKNNFLQNI